MTNATSSPHKVSRRRFLQKAGAGTVLAVASQTTYGKSTAGPVIQSKASQFSALYSGKRPQDYRVVLQDIGDPLVRMTWPPTPEKLVEASIGPLRDSAVDVYSFGVNHAGGTTHCSEVYPVVGHSEAVQRSASSLRINEAVKLLCDQGQDPLKVICEGAHREGIDVFLRLRMNDHHDRWGDMMNINRPTPPPKSKPIEPYLYTPQWKRDHRQWLIGDPEAAHPADTFKFMEAKAGNYALGPFRELMFKLATEVVTGYDLDGLEIDFFRSPFLFPHHEAYAQRHVMTAFVRRIRKLVKERGDQRGRPVYLSARVPSTVDLCLRIGIDLPTWLEEGLLDMVVVSNGLLPFSTPWHEIGGLAQQAGISALACFTNGRATREGRESLRAATYRAFSSGISGIHLWNYFYEMPFYHKPDEKYLGLGFTHDITDIELLRTAPKIYLLDQSIHTNARLSATFGHAEWPGQVPLTIGESTDGIPHSVIFDVADDLSGAGKEVRPRLWLQIVDLGPRDRIEFSWNGKPIQPNPKTFPGITVFDNREFEFELPVREVRRGENRLEIRLLERSARLEPYVTLIAGKLMIPQV